MDTPNGVDRAIRWNGYDYSVFQIFLRKNFKKGLQFPESLL